MLPVRVKNRNESRLAGTQMAGGDCRHSGSNASSGPGSMTAPESECAPTAEPFSRMQILSSGLSCFSRMAHARPAGPAPTIAMSYSITSRSTVTRLFLLLGLHTDGAVQADGFAVQHRILEDGGHELRELFGLAEAFGERH